MTRGDVNLETSSSQWLGERGSESEAGDLQTGQPAEGGGVQSNVSEAERAVSVAAGAVTAITGLSRGGLPGLLIAAVGGGLIYRGYTGHCPVYQRLDIDSTQDAGVSVQERLRRGIHIEQAWLINKSPQDLYDFWRNFENFPSFMSHVKSVQVIDEKRSHWTADAPAIAGGSVEWDAEITRDEPNELIAWRSLPGSSVDNAGMVRFSPAMGDRGTEVHVFLDYLPPAGRLGHWIAKLTSGDAEKQIHDDLRNVKRLLETGEIPTTSGQPRGSCIG
jgi:uncharacterized membrane protein